MNSTKQKGKFSRFLKNNAALLLIIFCVIAIAAVVLAVTLSSGDPTVDNVVTNPGNDDPNADKKPDNDPPANTDPKPDTPTTKKVYFICPVDYTGITMEYSEEVSVFNKTLNYWSTHKALDLAAADGSKVVAMFDGTVVDVSESYGMGYVVKIDHGNNVIATYASLSDVEVVKGDVVKQGETIGAVSVTASYEFLDGAHLHLVIEEKGKIVDPTPYVNGQIYREITVA